MPKGRGALLDDLPDEFVLSGSDFHREVRLPEQLSFKRDPNFKGVVYRAALVVEPWANYSSFSQIRSIEVERKGKSLKETGSMKTQHKMTGRSSLILRTVPMLIFFVISLFLIQSRDLPPLTGVVLLAVQVVLFIIAVKVWVPSRHR